MATTSWRKRTNSWLVWRLAVPQIDLAAAGLKGGIKGEGAVTEILDPMTHSPSRRERQHGIEPVEGLDGALFVHAEDGGMGRRGQIQSNDLGGFRFEIPSSSVFKLIAGL